ncbi:hypothetical protein BB560_002815 [Smittium megazygosporum]|uniref:Uncharacterized protein n=1 Tax=Smittium megazygosporum TaxID=133381 RepID=A0A2T9ZDR1_9FUNG|nr:hypothetical protein BB560_002815 [Smittium megazygosporum]
MKIGDERIVVEYAKGSARRIDDNTCFRCGREEDTVAHLEGTEDQIAAIALVVVDQTLEAAIVDLAVKGTVAGDMILVIVVVAGHILVIVIHDLEIESRSKSRSRSPVRSRSRSLSRSPSRSRSISRSRSRSNNAEMKEGSRVRSRSPIDNDLEDGNSDTK